MARYIDAELAIEKCNKLIDNADSCPNPYAIEGVRVVRNVILRECETGCPTADVAPKSEVAREIFDEAIRTVYSKIDMKIYNTIDGKPLGDAVAYGKQIAMYDVITLLAELKKKYTEETI